VFDFSEKLKQQPISVYVNNTVYGQLDWASVWYNGIFPALYKPASWYSLADNLAKLLQGNATDAWMAYGMTAAWDMEGDGNTFVTMNDALTGPEYWPQDRQSLLDEIIHDLNTSIFAPTENSGYYSKQQWKIPRTHNFTQESGIETAHPLLILSTTYDPICPLVSAKSAYSAFKGSQLVEVLGYGHCSIAVASTCLARHVRDFLYNGTLPDEYTKCEVDGSYFIKPEEDGKVTAQREFESDEDEQIHLAQLQLARDWEWRSRL
jgi:pimeloyl-ACP methyl ester carboxylesterase